MLNRLMMIRNKKELPHWFDLKKYEGANKLKAAGWYEQFAVRARMLQLCEARKSSRAASDRYAENFQELAAIARTTPIVDMIDVEDVYLPPASLQLIKKAEKSEALKWLSVRSVTPKDIYFLERRLGAKKLVEARRYMDQMFSFNELGTLESKEPSGMEDPIQGEPHIFGGNTGCVMIDLNLPDGILLEDFKRYLEASRPFHRRQKLNFSGWTNSSILPYLDLSIWAKENNFQIPNRVMADAIFLPGCGGEDTIHDTTSKLAVEAVSFSMLIKLSYQAIYERAFPSN